MGGLLLDLLAQRRHIGPRGAGLAFGKLGRSGKFGHRLVQHVAHGLRELAGAQCQLAQLVHLFADRILDLAHLLGCLAGDVHQRFGFAAEGLGRVLGLARGFAGGDRQFRGQVAHRLVQMADAGIALLHHAGEFVGLLAEGGGDRLLALHGVDRDLGQRRGFLAHRPADGSDAAMLALGRFTQLECALAIGLGDIGRAARGSLRLRGDQLQARADIALERRHAVGRLPGGLGNILHLAVQQLGQFTGILGSLGCGAGQILCLGAERRDDGLRLDGDAVSDRGALMGLRLQGFTQGFAALMNLAEGACNTFALLAQLAHGFTAASGEIGKQCLVLPMQQLGHGLVMATKRPGQFGSMLFQHAGQTLRRLGGFGSGVADRRHIVLQIGPQRAAHGLGLYACLGQIGEVSLHGILGALALLHQPVEQGVHRLGLAAQLRLQLTRSLARGTDQHRGLVAGAVGKALARRIESRVDDLALALGGSDEAFAGGIEGSDEGRTLFARAFGESRRLGSELVTKGRDFFGGIGKRPAGGVYLAGKTAGLVFQLAPRIGELDLQIGDMTTQRLAHAGNALVDVADSARSQ